ncbi:MAG: peptidylprolyl isomerase [Exilibacterium sp.]
MLVQRLSQGYPQTDTGAGKRESKLEANMTGIVKIGDEVINAETFITLLKLNGRFDGLMEDILKDKLTVHEAKRQGITLSEDDIQLRADQFRRAHGLQRATDTNNYFATLKITLDDFEAFITDTLYQEKMAEKIVDDTAVEAYFKANSPRFDSIVVSHIVMDSEGGARELLSLLKEEGEDFAAMAREHSVADTRTAGGYIGNVMRGSLQKDVEARVFNAEEGELLGPFATGDGTHHELFRIDSKRSAQLDEETAAEIRRLLREEWLAKKAREHRIEVL